MTDLKNPKKATNGHLNDLFVPEPTAQFYDELVEEHHLLQASLPLPRPNPIPIPIPIPFQFGSRVIIWKQDPSVGRLGRRLKYLPGLVLNGPRDARIKTELAGTTPVHANVYGDFIFRRDTPQADCAHTFAIVRETLKMYERALGGRRIPWAWNTGGNTDVISVYPRAGVTANAYYSRYQKALRFFYFTPSRSTTQVYTCRSLDIVSHETGHAVLDGLKPNWLGTGNPPQTGGLHESFGDLSAIFLALSDVDQVEYFIAMTKANLHAKNFLAALAEQFGAALGRPMGLRNADNNLKLSEVSNEVHAISQVFTGGMYDVLADIFAFEYRHHLRVKSPAHILIDVAEQLCKLLMQAIVKAPARRATYADVVNKMLSESLRRGDPAIYRSFIRNRFTFREVLVSPTPLTMMTKGTFDYSDANFVDGGEDVKSLEVALPNHPSLTANQDRSMCCGTMQLAEFNQPAEKLDKDLGRLGGEVGEVLSEEDLLAAEIQELQKEFK